MGSPPAVCRNCGARFAATAYQVQNSTDITFSECSTNCPYCGGTADIVDGTYDFVGDAISAFRAPGVTRAKVQAFEAIAKEVQSGTASPADAEARIAELGEGLARLWQLANQNAGVLSLILAIVAIYLTLSAGWSADETAAKLQAGVEKQTQVEQQILAELQKQNAHGPKLETSRQPTQQMRAPAPQQRPMQAKPNRQERRKAAAKARRQPPC